METLNKIGLFVIVMLIGFMYRRFMDKMEKDQEVRDLYIINKELLGKSKKPYFMDMCSTVSECP